MSSKAKDIILDLDQLQDWCVEVDPVKQGKFTQEIVVALKATMKQHNLVYLTAPQIGYNRRIVCLRFGKNDYRTFINPVVENNSNISFAREVCCSIPDKTYIIPRFDKIRIYYTTPLGKVESANLVGMSAHVMQHALDHINGVLVNDYGLEIDEMFDNATDEERAEVLQAYAESLDLREKELKKQIQEDKELQQLDEAINFMNSVKEGKTILDNTTDDTKDNQD